METKSKGSKSSVHPLHPVELERLQEAIQSFHMFLAWLASRRNTLEELRYYRAKREEFTVEDSCLLRGI